MCPILKSSTFIYLFTRAGIPLAEDFFCGELVIWDRLCFKSQDFDDFNLSIAVPFYKLPVNVGVASENNSMFVDGGSMCGENGIRKGSFVATQ